jgi:hypothetical protein
VMTRSAPSGAGEECPSANADALAKVASTCPGGGMRIGEADYIPRVLNTKDTEDTKENHV